MADLREEVRRLQEMRDAGQNVPGFSTFKKIGNEYYVDDKKVDEATFLAQQKAVDDEIRNLREGRTPGMEDMDDFAAQAKARAEARRRAGRKSGGSIKIAKTKISTHHKSKSSPKW